MHGILVEFTNNLPDARHMILAVFVMTYLGLAIGYVPGLKLDRIGIALLGAIAMLIVSGSNTALIATFIDWPTILLLFGLFVISSQLRLSGFYDRVAVLIAAKLDRPFAFLVILMFVTAGLSAILNHDVICFVFAPIVGAALLGQRINPVPFLVGLAIASNIGAAATLVGNPQNMMIGQEAGLNFAAYLTWAIVPVVFALVGAVAIIWGLSRNGLILHPGIARPAAIASVPFSRIHTIKGLLILGVVVVLFFTSLPRDVVALTAAGIHLASKKFKSSDLLRAVDWQILVLFLSLFVVAGAFQTTGYGDAAVQGLARAGLDLKLPAVLAITTAVLSNLVNNAAAVILLMKVVHLGDPIMAYILALANSFGGSMIVIGSVSNLIVVQQASEMGITIRFKDFARLGIPVTIVALGGLLAWVALMR
ncbi:MAG: SLC13 family permease [Holophaga sp.]